MNYRALIQITDPDEYEYNRINPKERSVTTLEESFEKMICADMEEHSDNHELTETQQQITTLLHNFKEFLIEKNRRYGDSSSKPINMFSKCSAEDQLLTRLDDKAKRIINSDVLRKNDVADMMGYIVLLMASKGWVEFAEFLD